MKKVTSLLLILALIALLIFNFNTQNKLHQIEHQSLLSFSAVFLSALIYIGVSVGLYVSVKNLLE